MKLNLDKPFEMPDPNAVDEKEPLSDKKNSKASQGKISANPKSISNKDSQLTGIRKESRLPGSDFDPQESALLSSP